MAVFAVLVIGNLEFMGLSLLFQGIMTTAAFLYRLSFLPNVFTILVFVVAASLP